MILSLVKPLKKMVVLIAVAILSGVAAADMVSEDCSAERGQKLFNKCLACHTYDKSNNHSAGPNLYGVVGRKVGLAEGFKFSPALRKSGDTWTEEHLDAFLQNPMGVYARSRMAFSGLKKPNDRADIICYLSKNTADQ